MNESALWSVVEMLRQLISIHLAFDMMRGTVHAFQEEVLLKKINRVLTDEEKENTKHVLEFVGEFCDNIRSDVGPGVITNIKIKLAREPITLIEMNFQYQTLMEVLHRELFNRWAYLYDPAKYRAIQQFDRDWAPIINSFPSAKEDARSAIECFGIAQNTACVFHLMRVLEHGLAALAKDVGKEFDVQNWQNIIDQIESEVRNLGKRLPSGAAKNARLQFLSEAAKEFVYFKDGWRNYVSHGRGNYDEYQARSVMEHVRSFMTTLSSKLSEEGV
jgi:hypothetical protein